MRIQDACNVSNKNLFNLLVGTFTYIYHSFMYTLTVSIKTLSHCLFIIGPRAISSTNPAGPIVRVKVNKRTRT